MMVKDWRYLLLFLAFVLFAFALGLRIGGLYGLIYVSTFEVVRITVMVLGLALFLYAVFGWKKKCKSRR